MKFTYDAYIELLHLLKQKKYDICNYNTYENDKRCVILRHDIDFSLEAALRFAELEYKNDVKATYFILLSTGFYNIFDRKTNEIIKKINMMGHDIGLHFDEARYQITDKADITHYIEKEISIMSNSLDMEIKVFSMHRPSKWVLESNLSLNSIINAYDKKFLEEFKYLSDSRMYWREDVQKIIENENYERLYILTHPIWYETVESTIRERLIDFINMEKYKVYENISDNIRGLDEILLQSDI